MLYYSSTASGPRRERQEIVSTKNIKDFLTPQERLEANARSQVQFEIYMAQGEEGLRETLRKFREIDRAKSQSDKSKDQNPETLPTSTTPETKN